MNREIKFRIAYKSAYTYPKNKWMISEPLTPYEMMFSEDTQVDFLDGGYLRFNEMADDKSKIVFQQWTGLKDIEGKEIYEGDIIKIGDNKVIINSIEDFYFKDSHPLNLTIGDDIIVIGNIFENKELIK